MTMPPMYYYCPSTILTEVQVDRGLGCCNFNAVFKQCLSEVQFCNNIEDKNRSSYLFTNSVIEGLPCIGLYVHNVYYVCIKYYNENIILKFPFGTRHIFDII